MTVGNITVKFEGLSPLIAAIEAIKPRLDAATREATKETGNTLERDARANFEGTHAPGFWHVGGDKPNTVSGNLQQSIIFLQPVTPQGPGRFATRIGPTSIYSRVIELGAHIDAKTTEYLHWFDAQYGVDRYKKSVDIPPRPFFTPARMTLGPKMEAIFYTAWKEAWHG